MTSHCPSLKWLWLSRSLFRANLLSSWMRVVCTPGCRVTPVPLRSTMSQERINSVTVITVKSIRRTSTVNNLNAFRSKIRRRWRICCGHSYLQTCSYYQFVSLYAVAIRVHLILTLRLFRFYFLVLLLRLVWMKMCRPILASRLRCIRSIHYT